MKHLCLVLCSVCFLYSCSKKDKPMVVENPPGNEVSAFRIIPTKAEVEQMVKAEIHQQGVPYTQITGPASLEEDLGLEPMYFFPELASALNISFPPGAEQTLTTVQKVINYISDVIFKENSNTQTVTGSIEFWRFGVESNSGLSNSLNLNFTCDLKYIKKNIGVEITSISSISSSISGGINNVVRTNNIEAAISNMSTAPSRVRDYIVTYQPTFSTTSLAEVVYMGYLTIERVEAYKCENFSKIYRMEERRFSLNSMQDFLYFDPGSPTNGIAPITVNYDDISTSLFEYTPPSCYTNDGTPGGGTPGNGGNKPTITSQQLQDKFNLFINERMEYLDRPISNMSLSLRLIEDLQFTSTLMSGDVDLDYNEFIIALKQEFGGNFQWSDNIIESFTTLGSIYNYITTGYNVI